MPQNTNDLIPGGGPNQPGGLAQITSGGFYSTSTLGYAVQPAYSFSDDSLGFYQSATSTVALSYGTLSLPGTLSVASISLSGVAAVASTLTVGGIATFSSGVSINGVLSVNTLSMATYGAASGMTTGQVVLIFNASGLSLAYSSGKSMYFFGGSTVSAVQS